MSVNVAGGEEPDAEQIVLRPPVGVLVGGLITSIYALTVLVTTIPYPGKIGVNYNALGTDWMVFYGAIRSVLDGHASLIFDAERFTDFLNTAFADWLSKPLDLRPWAYPPSFLLLLLPFPPLGFFGSYVAFQLATAGLLAVALRFRAADWTVSEVLLPIVLLCPASFINVIDGQAVFLVAALIVGGLRLLKSRPVLGGLILGLLTFKPQFCILVPLALIASGQWRAFWGAGLSAMALVAASGAIFGWELWLHWFPLMVENLAGSGTKWIEVGRIWGNSVYTCAMLLGAPQGLASGLQLLAALFAAGSVVIAFRSRLGVREKMAVFLAATMLAAPHSGPYDQALVTLAAVFWLTTMGSPRPPLWCWTLALLIWLVPLVSPPVLIPVSRPAPLLTAALIVLVLQRRPAPAEPPLQRKAGSNSAT
ncbi:glycosyltransferase family 87 protein [Bradyrhizobium elkanii]|uniref:Alpha-1,2-mannosyltransferase n=1 Tax=Bradyrhizobium elkanii TaxID=29448 RepID=A0ABV4EXG6_BRAEL|nr:glycosyltransferase family 87 protein [Bradyrhizobium elkanii]MCP1756871.1 hypothetical protein [Bradyrhizobium elkanii]MCP1982384.1 hypothetical protein [Bradyrhizobium elkanii]MCS3882832.1 hypothetical protein [Bradyrhizobium elkanii]MCS4218111.1 hypothetical protein [Bradyrhizobium elkanii]MCW2195439.1 hypothetical protein [Bradyrhizobium elkanii]